MKIGDKVITIDSCSSTNDLAREAAVEGEEEGLVFIAEEQKKGRGTQRQNWFSAKNKGLYASVILRPKRPQISLIPLLTGLAVKDTIGEMFKMKIKLKWPNDILWKGQKLGGILCESSFVGDELIYVILGIGLNLNYRKEEFPEDIRDKATSLWLMTKKDLEMPLFLDSLWKKLDFWYSVYCLGDSEKITTFFNKNSFFSLGTEITITAEEEKIEGIYCGINTNGGIIIKSQGRKRSFYAAEVEEAT